MAAVMRLRSFKAGELICREGEQGESMFVIVDGLVDLLRSLAEMPEVRTRSIFDEGRLVGKLRPGDVVGTGSLITGEPRSATAKAAVDSDLLELGQRGLPRPHRQVPAAAREPEPDPHAPAGRGHGGAGARPPARASR